MPSEHKTIVLLGAGFGGITAYQRLRTRIDRRRWQIVIVNRTDHFLFSPLLHEVATGGLSGDEVVEGVHTIIDRDCAKLVQADVTSVDRDARVVHTSAGPVSYERLIVALGSETDMHHVPGVSEHALALKTLKDAQVLRDRFARLFQQASQATDPTERKRLLTVVIVGGGSTGVELAAEAAELFTYTFRRFYSRYIPYGGATLTLIHGGPELLPEFHKVLRDRAALVLKKKGIVVRLNMRVSAVDGQGVMLEGGEQIPAGTVIWTGGVKPIEVAASPSWPLNDHGRLDVDDTLLLRGSTDVWAIGDCAGTWPYRAQVASRQGPVVADNVMASIFGSTPRAFRFRSRGELVSLGSWEAGADVFGIRWTGAFAWWMWRTVYLFNFPSWSKRLRIMVDWTIHLFMPRDITSPGQ